MIQKGIKFRIYPTKRQEEFLDKNLGCARYVYNYFLNLRKESYKENKTKISGYECCDLIVGLKEKLPWLKEVNSQSLQQSILNLDDAYKRFFKKESKYPVFKKKKNGDSFSIPQHFSLLPDENCIKIPKLKTSIKTVFTKSLKDIEKINFITISKTPTEKYFV